MDIVIGVTSDERGRDAVALGLALAGATGATPWFVHVRRPPWDIPSPARVDAEWEAYLVDEAEATLAKVRAETGDPAGARYLVHVHPSSGWGLADAAELHGARLIVVGSAPGGRAGHVHIGSTADQLLHGSPVPVALAPQGWAERAEAPSRIVVGYQGSAGSARTVQAYADAAARYGMDLHLLSIVERVTRLFGTRLGLNAEEQVLQSLEEQFRQAQDAVLPLLPEHLPVTTQVVRGDTMADALGRVPWRPGDLLGLGSAETGWLRRVFLGDVTFRLVRAATVPVVVATATAAG